MATPGQRFIELDAWRGLAIIGMVIFHVIFFYDYLGIRPFSYAIGEWHVLARCVQWSFLLLVGIGVQLAYQKSLLQGKSGRDFFLKNTKRAFIVFGCGMLVTVFSAFLDPVAFVRFGVLHLIGVSILFLGFVVRFPKTSLALSGTIYLLSYPISQTVLTAFWPVVLGFQTSQLYISLDHFPLFPWLAIPLLGSWLGSVFFKGFQRSYHFPTRLEQFQGLRVLSTIGQHSLLIYLIHAPIILLVLSALYLN